MRGYPQFSFWISITLVKICFFRIFSKPRKNTFELVGTILKNNTVLGKKNANKFCAFRYFLRKYNEISGETKFHSNFVEKPIVRKAYCHFAILPIAIAIFEKPIVSIKTKIRNGRANIQVKFRRDIAKFRRDIAKFLRGIAKY